MPEERDAALERAVRALARRDHSTESLRAKLERAGVSAPATQEAVDALARAGYLDDERFARDRAAVLVERGYGDDWIRADLEAQGVAAEPAEAAVAALEPERDRAFGEAVKLGAGPGVARTLGRRGFTEESIESVQARAVAEEP